MTLHLFNPSHDEALAAGSPYYTPSAAARALEESLALLPCQYARRGDFVLVPDKVCLALPEREIGGVRIISLKDIPSLRQDDITSIEPWGWDAHIVHRLRRAGICERLLPSAETLEDIRSLSSRASAVCLLEALRKQLPESIGESRWCRSEHEVLEAISAFGGKAMLKAPWSCSGRGVFLAQAPLPISSLGRLRSVLAKQGAVEAEPYYERVLDFAMEFRATASGKVLFEGLSLFTTDARGAYTGNYVAPDARLAERIAAAGWRASLEDVAQKTATALSSLIEGRYCGILGVDMMLVRDTGNTIRLHPCVEINFRKTMGSVAVALRRLLPDGAVGVFIPAQVREGESVISICEAENC